MDRKFPLDAEIASATAKGETILSHMENITKPYRFSTRAELLQSREAGLAIVQEAVNRNVDAVVLGIPYLEKYGSFSIGKTIPYVLENAPCRVIIWRGSIRLDIQHQGHLS